MMTTRIADAAQTLGRKGGSVSSPAKKLAARINGRKGGRPVLHRYMISSKAGEDYGIWVGRTKAHALATMLHGAHPEIQWDKEHDTIVYPNEEIKRSCGSVDDWDITEVEKVSRRRGNRPILHKDGTVTYWSVFKQQWERRVVRIPDNELAAMGEKQRDRVINHLIGD